jgi:ABC-type branched-subunit amino acid transport system substrate-binding protein
VVPALTAHGFYFLLFVSTSIWLSGCQSGAIDALDPNAVAAEPTPAAAAPLTESRSIGTGEAKVTMLLPLSAPGPLGKRGARMRDAAMLAMEDIGGNLITLTIMDTGGQDVRAKQLAHEAMSSGVAVVLGPVEQQASQQLAAISGAKRPPVLSLAENYLGGGTRVYGVTLNEADSAAAGAAAVANMGARKFALVVPEGALGRLVEKRVTNAVANVGGSLAVTLRFDPMSASPLKVAADLSSLIDSPDAIVVAVDGANPQAFVSALKDHGLTKGHTRIVGTYRWLDHYLGDPIFNDILVASLDSNEIGPVKQRFQQAYHRDADLNAAYAYDLVALASALVSARGPDGFTSEVLEVPSGFRGSTGVFRFRSDGTSERSMPLYRLEKGKLKMVSKAVQAF